jgi:putative phosphoesterase
MTKTIRIGLISDTHGLLRDEAVHALRGSDYIVHAGDICDPDILVALARIAPVTAVRGNNDRGPWTASLPERAELQVGDVRLLVIHDLATLDADPLSLGARVVISGHSHRPLIETRSGVLYVNPGSAGPRRFRLPIALGHLAIRGNGVRARIRELNPPERSVQRPTLADTQPSPPSRPKAGACAQAPRR